MTASSTTSVRRVLVATDLDGAHDDEALQQADRLARAFGAELGVVNVLPPGFPEHTLTPHKRDAEHEDDTSEATRRAAVEVKVTRATGRSLGAFELFIERGDAGAAILDRSKRYPADIIVVGTHGRHGVEKWILGSVAEKVARGALCPVLVCRPSPTDGRILAACDLEARTQPVLLWASALSQRFGQPILAAHTIDLHMSDVALVASAVFSGAVPPQPDTTSAQALREVATGALRSELTGAAVVAEAEVLSGPAASMIAGRANEIGASLIVVGTHGRKGVRRLTLGSVAENVMQKAPCSVLVVH